jgi:glycosyltransferase involved in cell wall biosynthesis
VSVIVCTFNREALLPGALESLARQTLDTTRYEIVIVNNNSTDLTDRMCRSFIEAHPELHTTYVTERQQGLSHARNRGMAEAKGRLLTYIDDDARATPEFLAKVVAFFQSHPDAAAAGGRVLATFEGDRPAWFNPFSASTFFSHYDRGNAPFRFTRRTGYPIGCNMTVCADVLRKANGFDTALGRRGKDAIGAEEKELFSRLIDWDAPVYYDPDQVVFHQIEPSRTERSSVRKLALGLGQTHRAMYCRSTFSAGCLWQLMLTLMKLAAAAGLALLYLARGRPQVSTHLVWYRWLVVKGMFTDR